MSAFRETMRPMSDDEILKERDISDNIKKSQIVLHPW
jgi:hypothetical protein